MQTAKTLIRLGRCDLCAQVILLVLLCCGLNDIEKENLIRIKTLKDTLFKSMMKIKYLKEYNHLTELPLTSKIRKFKTSSHPNLEVRLMKLEQ